MSNILSQDEVDALLHGVSSGDVDVDPDKAEAGGQTTPYDLTSQERIIRGRMPAMEMTNERLARHLRMSLSSVLRRMVEVVGVSVGITKFVDFTRTIPLPSSINLFKMHPLTGTALLVLGAPIVFTLIELFFGGSGKSRTKTEGREFTPIEQTIIKKIVLMFLNNIEEAWQMIVPLKTEYIGSEMNPQFVNIVAPTELVLKIELSVEVEAFSDKIFICIPYSMVEPVKEKLHSSFQSDNLAQDDRWVGTIKKLLFQSSVDLSVVLGRAQLTIGDLKELKEGDVLVLDTDKNSELPLCVEGVPKFSVRPGMHHGAQAVKITSILSQKDI